MDNNKKNLLIISYDFCLEAGGIQNTSYLLAEELLKYINVYTLSPANGNMPCLPNVRSFRCKYARNSIQRKLYDKESVVMVETIHQKYKIDYILLPDYNYALPALNLFKKYGVPYGVMTHGNDVMKYTLKFLLEHPRSHAKMFFERKKILNNATHVFSNTEFTKSLVKQITSNRNIHVINPPISMIPQNIGSFQKGNTIISIGRLVERKGYQNVIKALSQVVERCPDVKYIICGKGEYEAELKSLVKNLHLEKVVIFKGRISEEEKTQILSKCSLLIMPSFVIKDERQVEGFGIALIEANAYGKFVISSRSGGIPEAVKENETGFLVEENNIKDIADAIIRFFDSDFQYCPNKCLEWARKRHISIIAQQYYDIISQVI